MDNMHSAASLQAFLKTDVARHLFARTFWHEHSELLEWAPTEWLLALANPHPLETTTTAGADGLPNRRVDMQTLYKSMVRDGMRDPLVLGIGQNNKLRLEEGNQRIYVLADATVPYVPVLGLLGTTAITTRANGPHTGLTWQLRQTIPGEVLGTFVRASDYLANSPLLAGQH